MSTYSPLEELNLLMDFQEAMGAGSYAPGFELVDFGDFATVETRWSAQPGFLDRIIPFAQGDSEGSVYALWRVDDFTPLARMPVVVFGAEAGTHVVAEDVLSMFRLLALSPRLHVDEDQVFYTCAKAIASDPEDDGADGSAKSPAEQDGLDHHEDFVEWLAEVFSLPPAVDCSIPVAEAQTIFADSYRQWSMPYLTLSSEI